MKIRILNGFHKDDVVEAVVSKDGTWAATFIDNKQACDYFMKDSFVIIEEQQDSKLETFKEPNVYILKWIEDHCSEIKFK